MSKISPEEQEWRMRKGDQWISFDKTINIGNILTIIILFITTLSAFYSLKSDFRDLSFKVELLWADYLRNHPYSK